jgi:hypothetical protein
VNFTFVTETIVLDGADDVDRRRQRISGAHVATRTSEFLPLAAVPGKHGQMRSGAVWALPDLQDLHAPLRRAAVPAPVANVLRVRTAPWALPFTQLLPAVRFACRAIRLCLPECLELASTLLSPLLLRPRVEERLQLAQLELLLLAVVVPHLRPRASASWLWARHYCAHGSPTMHAHGYLSLLGARA